AVRRPRHRGRALHRRDLLRYVGAGLMAVGPRPAGPSLARSVPLAALMVPPAGGDPLHTLRHDLSNPLAAILAETQLLLLNAERFRSEEHTSELQSRFDLVCRLLLEKKKK